MVTSSKRTYASMSNLPGLLQSVFLTLQQTTVNTYLRQRLLNTHRQVSVQSLVRSLLLSPGPWFTQYSVCALQESVSPILCEFCQLYSGANGDLLQEGLCHTQVYCTQSPCPCSSPLLTRTSSGDTQTQ